MGDKATLAKAKKELEELYLGIPDDSVNLTFGDLAEVRPQNDNKKPTQMDPLTEASPRTEKETLPLAKLPSLDFSRGLEASARSDNPIHYRNQLHHIHPFSHINNNHHVPDDSFNSSVNHVHHGHGRGAGSHGHRGHHHVNGDHQTHGDHHANGHYHHMDHLAIPYSHRGDAGFRHATETSMYDDMSQMTDMTVNPFQERGGRRRAGIPHSNICTICSTYIYLFRHRCLVCGRVYCRQCVGIGMGEMTEGRKCNECLGRRFSQRYIQRAGKLGCCAGYPSIVKQQELKWAEKGPRRTGENQYGRSGMMSRSRSPAPRTPTRPHDAPSSFVMSSPYSPYYSPTNHPLPF